MVPSLVVITFVTVKDLADQVGDPQRDPELGNKSTAAAAAEGGMDLADTLSRPLLAASVSVVTVPLRSKRALAWVCP